jgi:uncharacterized membrane protein
MMMRSVLFAAAAALTLAQAPEAAAKKDESISTGTLDIQVCNRSGYDAFVAVIRRTEQGWLASGWFRVDNGNCNSVGATNNLVFYLFAEQVGDMDYVWAGDFEQCVMRPGPYDIWVDPNADNCPNGMTTEQFRELEADTWGAYTWNLTP